MRIMMPIGHSIATPTKSMNPLKGARHDHLQSEKFGFRTADSGTAHGICGRWRWQPGRCSTWRWSGCGRDGQCRRWRRSAGRIRWRWPPAGLVGGGSPNSNNAAGNGAAGTGNPSLNAVGGGSGGNGTNTPGISNAKSNGSDIGGYGGSTGVAPASHVPGGGTSPEALRSQSPSATGATAPNSVQGVAEEAPSSTIGLARPGPDGVSTVIVAPRPCGVAAHETDGTTTCIGISDRSPRTHRR